MFTVPRYSRSSLASAHPHRNTSRVKAAAYRAAMTIGRRHARARWEGSQGNAALYGLARLLVFNPLLEQLGLDEVELDHLRRRAAAAGDDGAVAIWGVNLVEIYGQTEEAGAIISGQRGPFPRPGNVGTVAPGWELKLAESGEILVRGPHVFAEYLNHPEATRE